jgi:hypothetical protein
MKNRALKISLALATAVFLAFSSGLAAFASTDVVQQSGDPTTPLGRFLESLKKQGGTNGAGTGGTGGTGSSSEAKKQYFLTIANKVDAYAEGDSAETKYEFQLVFNKGTESEASEKLTLKNKGAKVFKLEEGTTYAIESKADGRYAVDFKGGAEGTMDANKTVTVQCTASSTFSLTISNGCAKGGPGNSVSVRIVFDEGARYETVTVKAGESKVVKNIPNGTKFECETTATGVSVVKGTGTIQGNTTVTIKDSATPPSGNGDDDASGSNGATLGDDDDDDDPGDDDSLGNTSGGEKTGDDDDDDSPTTGDASSFALWAFAGCASFVGLGAVRKKAVSKR